MNINKRTIQCGAVLALIATLVYAANRFDPNDQSYGYGPPVAASGLSVASGNEVIYAPSFESSTFSGDLSALPIDATGDVDLLSPLWRAKIQLNDQDWDSGRRIVTTDGDGSAIPFRFGNLTEEQQTALNDDSEIVEFVRGNRNTSLPRARDWVLGDIIHSNPSYVAAPRSAFPFGNYLTFASNNASRAARVYVGANDGMLHAFDAATGDEVFGFVPSQVMDNLPKLTEDPYAHQYFVDGPITVQDAQIGTTWHTVLVGGLGAGGQGYYALDVTSASATSEAGGGNDAASKVLWEYDSSDNGSLGYTYARPSIVRLNTGGWGVVVGNGYSQDPGGGHRASLIVLDVETGDLVREITVKVVGGQGGDNGNNPNGLGSPTVIDENGDFKADTVYAGDIKGNLWKFDISDPDANQWDTAHGDKDPLFKATVPGGTDPQSITTAPAVTRHPSQGFMVYFATGRLFDSDDKFDKSTKSVYGIWDLDDWNKNDLPTASDLVEQTLSEKTYTTADGTDLRVRVASNNAVDLDPSSAGMKKGWRVDLPGGERVLTDPILRNERLQFNSVNPTLQTGENWLMQLPYLTGGAPSQAIIDVNQDGAVAQNDNVDGNGDGDISDPVDRVVGQYKGFGLASGPSIVALSATDDSALINHLRAINPAALPPDPDDPGIAGGHIDLDTSTEIYDFGDGETNNHVHEWDDDTGLTSIDFMRMTEECATPGDPSTCVNPSDFDDADDQLPDAQHRFVITVANSEWNSGAVLQINGTNHPVTDYEKDVKFFAKRKDGDDKWQEKFQVYQLGPLDADDVADGVERLTDFGVSFDNRAILAGGVIPTQTGCVKGNEAGPKGEYRNGALLVQVVDADGAVDEKFHYATDGLFWESTVFWHWKGPCAHEDDWENLYKQCVIGQDYENAECQEAMEINADGTLAGKDKDKDAGKDKDKDDGKDKGKDDGKDKGKDDGKDKGKGDDKGNDDNKGKGNDGDGDSGDDSGAVLDPEHEVTNTTSSGSNVSERLLWRELIY